MGVDTIDCEKTFGQTSKDTAEADGEVEWTYPDGGFRAWLVVLGCFIMACTCM
jgi:hypothetical protein